MSPVKIFQLNALKGTVKAPAVDHSVMTYFDNIALCQENVLRLEVPVKDMPFMHILKSHDHKAMLQMAFRYNVHVGFPWGDLIWRYWI